MNEHNGTTFFLNGQVGIGQTFYYNMIIVTFHAQGKNVICFASLVFLLYKKCYINYTFNFQTSNWY
jgi:hypothetical protein